ncbi:alpha/beta hydrolase [Pedobacter frigidisoli]|nr:alpha/beta hydrolase [Pedobacter frigidisoli]
MRKIILSILLTLVGNSLFAQAELPFSQRETTYDRRDGASLTLTILTPKNANGKGIISLMSGNFVSDYNSFTAYRERALPFVRHGYTVFLVMHRSAPRFALPDMLEDVQRAVQFVRYHAADYNIDPARLGITGTSSGGHLALLTALSKDVADPISKDPIAKVSTRLQAVAVFCPPTDLLNFGRTDYNLAADKPTLVKVGVLGAFGYTNWDSATRTYIPIDNLQQRRKIDSLMSPAQVAGKNAPPTFLMHGDKDPLVPIQQSQTLATRLHYLHVPVKLVVKPGAAHGWKGMDEDEHEFNAWFDLHLR